MGPSDPGSWNRYNYVEGDPLNSYDPEGLYGHCLDGYHTFAGSHCVPDDTVIILGDRSPLPAPTGGGTGDGPAPTLGPIGPNPLGPIKKGDCPLLPTGHAYSVNIGTAGILGGGGSAELVLDYTTGHAYLVVSPVLQASGSGVGAGFSNGYIFSTNGSGVQGYIQGGTTSASFSVPTPEGALTFGVGASSNGIGSTVNPLQYDPQSATIGSVGFSVSTANLLKGFSAQQSNATHYDLGNYMTGLVGAFIPLNDMVLTLAKQGCATL